MRRLAPPLIGFLLLFAMIDMAVAGSPEYMKINPRVGQTIEAKGYLNAEGIFVATDIELLDGQRRPKVRAPISRVDTAGDKILVLGMSILIDEDTEFDTEEPPTLSEDQHIEVKCDVEEDGSWVADAIRTQDVKPSVKVKVTITGTMVDGAAPDTLDCSGFRILLVDATDVAASSSMPTWRDYLDYREIAYSDASSVGRGMPMANNRILVTAEYRHNLQSAKGYALTQQFPSDLEDTQPELRAGFAAYVTPEIRTLVQFRIRQRYIVSSEAGVPPTELEAHFYQLHVLFKNIRRTGLSIKVGRQRFKEPREWLFDEYLDAVRGIYAYKRLQLDAAYIQPVHPFKLKFRTWQDLYAAVGVFGLGGKTTAYVLIRQDDDDARRREPIYYGLRYNGDIARILRLWGDWSLLRGEDKHRQLDAWAIDVGAALRLRKLRFQPFASVAYAVGSGRSPGATGVDGRYRQTGYQDNDARLGGVNSVQYYGTVLDPELSNLEIFSAGAGLRPFRDLSLEIVYHRYFQQFADDGLRGNLIDPPARPNGVDPDIGWGLDGILGTRKLWNHIRLSWTIGLFQPGPAFSPRQDTAIYNRLDVRIQL